jgi:hypothetical protein
MESKFKASVPGPGEYSQDFKKSIPSMKFGTGTRQSIEMRKNVPGPGEYVGSYETVTKAAPKFG